MNWLIILFIILAFLFFPTTVLVVTLSNFYSTLDSYAFIIVVTIFFDIYYQAKIFAFLEKKYPYFFSYSDKYNNLSDEEKAIFIVSTKD